MHSACWAVRFSCCPREQRPHRRPALCARACVSLNRPIWHRRMSSGTSASCISQATKTVTDSDSVGLEQHRAHIQLSRTPEVCCFAELLEPGHAPRLPRRNTAMCLWHRMPRQARQAVPATRLTLGSGHMPGGQHCCYMGAKRPAMLLRYACGGVRGVSSATSCKPSSMDVSCDGTCLAR